MTGPRPRPGVLDISPYVGGESGVPGAKDVIRLASNESALGASPKARAAYESVAAELHRYPDGASLALRQAIGRIHGLDPARIVCGAGSDEILSLLGQIYAGPGDEIVYSEYGFLMFKILALAVGAKPVAAPETRRPACRSFLSSRPSAPFAALRVVCESEMSEEECAACVGRR